MCSAKPVRIQRSRQKKQVSPNGLPIVYVGRGSKWGNPFKIVPMGGGFFAIEATEQGEYVRNILLNYGKGLYDSRRDAAKAAVRCYQEFVAPYKHSDGNLTTFFHSMALIDGATSELKGKNLSCWCGLDEICHADFLLELANKP